MPAGLCWMDGAGCVCAVVRRHWGSLEVQLACSTSTAVCVAVGARPEASLAACSVPPCILLCSSGRAGPGPVWQVS